MTIIWSCEIVIHSAIPHGVSPFATSCMTSLIGALLLVTYFYRRIGIALKEQGSRFLKRVALLGILNATYNVLYLIGLEYFDVSTGVFTASMAGVVLPVMVLLLERTTSMRTWISSGIVLVGIIVALVPNVVYEQMNGVAIMTIGALVRAVFIIKLNDFSREHDPVTLAAGLTSASAIISFFPWVTIQPLTFFELPWSPRLIATYFIFGYFIVAFATVLNIYAQRRASAAHSTIIYSTEIVFSTIWAAVLPEDIVEPSTITSAIIAGCILVVIGNLVELINPQMGWEQEDESLAHIPDKLSRPIKLVRKSEPAVEGPAPLPARQTDNDTIIHVSHPFARRLDGVKSRFARQVTLFFALLAVYLVIALPFKVLTVIPGFTDVRPVDMLFPIYGIFFGLPGCFASSIGNFISDIASDSLRWSSIGGLVVNFLCPFIMYVFWSHVHNRPFQLRTRRRVAQFCAMVLLCSIVATVMLVFAVSVFYDDVDLFTFGFSVFSDFLVFPIAFSIPFMILIQEEFGYEPAPPLWQ